MASDGVYLLEQIVLGGMISDPKILQQAISDLIEDDFADLTNRKLFSIMSEMHSDGKSVDIGSIIDPAAKENISVTYTCQLTDTYNDKVLLSSTMPDRIKSLATYSDKRFAFAELQGIRDQIKTAKLMEATDIRLAIDTLSERLKNRHSIYNEENVGNDAKTFLDRRIRAMQGRIPFGLKPVDDIIGGLGKGQLVIIAARPSVGKSALSLIPLVNGSRHGYRTRLITLEMTKDEVIERLVAMMSGVSISTMLGFHSQNETQTQDMLMAMRELSALPLGIEESIRSTTEVESVLVAAQNAGSPIRLLVIDYFGLMVGNTNGRRNASMVEEYSKISKDLKQLALKYDLTIILLSQLNRSVGKYDPPSMEHLRETGSLEQDADKIIFLWRDRNDERLTNFAVEKNRQGVTGEGVLIFDGSTMRFSEVT